MKKYVPYYVQVSNHIYKYDENSPVILRVSDDGTIVDLYMNCTVCIGCRKSNTTRSGESTREILLFFNPHPQQGEASKGV